MLTVDKYKYKYRFSSIFCGMSGYFHLKTTKKDCFCRQTGHFTYWMLRSTACSVWISGLLTLRLPDQEPSDSPGLAAGGCCLAPSAGWGCWAGLGGNCRTTDVSGCDDGSSFGWQHGWCFSDRRFGAILQRESKRVMRRVRLQ